MWVRTHFGHFLGEKIPNCDQNMPKMCPNTKYVQNMPKMWPKLKHLSKMWPKSALSLETFWSCAQNVTKKCPKFGHILEHVQSVTKKCPKFGHILELIPSHRGQMNVPKICPKCVQSLDTFWTHCPWLIYPKFWGPKVWMSAKHRQLSCP